MEDKNKKDINRRDFIKIVGISAATSTGLLYGCSSKGTTFGIWLYALVAQTCSRW